MAQNADNFSSAVKKQGRLSVAPFAMASHYEASSQKENHNPQRTSGAPFATSEQMHDSDRTRPLGLKQIGKTDSFSLVEEQSSLMKRSSGSNVEMNRNSTNQYGVSAMYANSRTPQSAVDVDDSPMFYYQNSNSNGRISSQNSEDIKMLKSIQKQSKRRLNMDDEESGDSADQILRRKPRNLGLDQEMVTPL